MRWPFGPPHLTLKPSPKTKTPKNKTTKTKKQKKEKKKKRKQKNKKIQKYPKRAFQLLVNLLFLFGGCPKFPFLTTLPKTHAHKKHFKNGVSATRFLEKQFCVTKRPFLDKKTNPETPVIFFFLPFSSLSTTRNTNISWNPYFYSVLANLKVRFFKIQTLTQKLEKLNVCTFFFKAIFWKLPDNWAPRKTHNDNWAKQKSPETPTLIVRKWPWTS